MDSSADRSRGEIPSLEPIRWWTRMWEPFWVLPTVISLAALVLGLLLPEVEALASVDQPYLFQGGPEGARSLLTTIASAMISVTGLVFSITIVVLQLASSQFTPRLLAWFLRSRITQVTLGVFAASFMFALASLRSVHDGLGGEAPVVPQISVALAFLLVVAAMGCFLAFIHNITTSIQVAQVITRIGDETVNVVRQVFPHRWRPDEAVPAGPTWSPRAGTERIDVVTERHGSVRHVEHAKLVELARRLDAVVVVAVGVGDYVPPGRRIAAVWGRDALAEADRTAVEDALFIGRVRVIGQDVAFGVRQLVDIAERALSPGVNDPTTAAQVVDEIHRILRGLCCRETPSPYIVDEEGTVRVLHRPQRVVDIIDLGVREIAYYGRNSLAVPSRLLEMLDDLAESAAPTYRAALEQLRAEVEEMAATGDTPATHTDQPARPATGEERG